MWTILAYAAAASFPMTCSYNLADGSGPMDVPCAMSEPQGTRNYTVVYRIQGRTFKVEHTGRRNGLWSRILINGKPGMRFELYRSSFIYVTDDMSVSLEARGRGDPKFPEG